MAPDRPDGSDVETGVGLATEKNFSYCQDYLVKEGDNANAFSESKVKEEVVREHSLTKNEIEEKENQSDDDLTSLSWLHQQNILTGLEISASNNKDLKKEILFNNNVCEDSLDISDENTNSISSYEEIASPETNGKDGFPNTTFEQSTYQSDGKSVIKFHRSTPETSSNSSLQDDHGKVSINNNNVIKHNFNNNLTAANRNKHPTHIPYDPQLHRNSKPPYSFSCLIFMAIEDSPLKALPVKEVYAWILEHFPYFRNAPTGWKNSVRHNLSLNKCFRKVEKSPSLGKGSLWMVDAQYRPNLIQALSRAPCPTTSCTTTNNASTEKSVRKVSTNTRLPDPVLFPYLSKRLASSNIRDTTEVDFDDDIDAAAAAMLSFKHGHVVLNSKEKSQNAERRKKSQDEKLVPVITRSSTEDHTYSLVTSVRLESFNNSTITDFDEQRKIAEGADALLNLAGVNTMIEHVVKDSLAIKRRTGSSGHANLPDKRCKRWRDWNENDRYLKQQVRG